MATSARSPATALAYLDDLSTDVRAALLVDADGRLAAHRPEAGEAAGDFHAALAALVEHADAAAGEADAAEIEVVTPAGTVFVVRGETFTLAAIADRTALSSLMRYDLRHVLADLDGGA